MKKALLALLLWAPQFASAQVLVGPELAPLRPPLAAAPSQLPSGEGLQTVPEPALSLAAPLSAERLELRDSPIPQALGAVSAMPHERAEPAAVQGRLQRLFDLQGLRAAGEPRSVGGNPLIDSENLGSLLPSAYDKETWSGRVTLHLHSYFSDGTMSPEDVVEAAYKAGVRVLSLTDHDTTAGLERAEKKAKELGMTFIPGAELTAAGGAHIGADDIDKHNSVLIEHLKMMRDNRWKKAQLMLENLNDLPELKEKGIVLTMEEVEAKSHYAEGGTIELPHIARVLVDKGLIKHVDDAFNHLLKGKVFDGTEKFPDPTIDEVVRVIRAADGKAYLNHPYTVRTHEKDGRADENAAFTGEQDRAIEEIIQKGMDGIEVYRPSNARSEEGKKRADARAAKYLRWVDQYSTPEKILVAVPGADFHGSDTHLNHLVVWMPKTLSAQLVESLRSAGRTAVQAFEAPLRGSEPEIPRKLVTLVVVRLAILAALVGLLLAALARWS